MKLIRRLLAIAVLCSITATAETPALPAEQRTEIVKLLKVSGVGDAMKPMMAQMIGMMKQQGGSLPDEFWARMEKKFDTSELLDLLIPVYAKHYSLEELKALNEFYATPLGRKLVISLPLIMQESMQVGQVWGQKKGQQLAEEMKAEQAK
jgi:uncharacterized protein